MSEGVTFIRIERREEKIVARFLNVFGVRDFVVNRQSLLLRIENLKRANLDFEESEKALRALEEEQKK